MFTAFLFRGLSLPAHEFLRSLLFFYGIQLWQLTPNSILHLSIFITVCEAFLGIDPHWGLWRKIFYVKRHNDSNAPRRRWRRLSVTRCSGGDGGVDGGDDDDDDDGDDVQLDDDGDGVDFPLREGISPVDSCPPESSFLSRVLRPTEAAVTLREVLPLA
ncbi:hypothetical protein QYE76_057244 [Lolium multiflorum]|uniref:Transposase (putative) gypsy type domain-containing protein n=1 Tax=Lolium multiflorum TaxID=4521 RepID=A0AAD8WR86_LOLMU|nr:hypothetical protein QYE76_057244 [Lolium multiflorum]